MLKNEGILQTQEFETHETGQGLKNLLNSKINVYQFMHLFTKHEIISTSSKYMISVLIIF